MWSATWYSITYIHIQEYCASWEYSDLVLYAPIFGCCMRRKLWYRLDVWEGVPVIQPLDLWVPFPWAPCARWWKEWHPKPLQVQVLWHGLCCSGIYSHDWTVAYNMLQPTTQVLILIYFDALVQWPNSILVKYPHSHRFCPRGIFDSPGYVLAATEPPNLPLIPTISSSYPTVIWIHLPAFVRYPLLDLGLNW